MTTTKALRFSFIAIMAMMILPCKLLAQTAQDVLTAENLIPGITGVSYYEFSNKQFNSTAVYAGTVGTFSKEMALKLKDSGSGIVTTASGGTVKSVIIKWNTSTSSPRSIKVYGKTSAYKSEEDLYKTTVKEQGTLIGTVNYVAARSDTLIVDGDYTYVGISATGGTVYIDEIGIVWQSKAYSKAKDPVFSPAPGKYSDTQYVTISAAPGNTIYYTTTGVDPTFDDTCLYDGMPVCIDQSTTVKAVSIDGESGEVSDIVTAAYTIERQFAFDVSAATTTLGRTFKAPVLMNTYIGGDVTWNSSDDAVAVVSTDGNVTPLSAGTTTITAILTLPDVDPLTASYVLTVKNAPEVPVGGAYYKRITSAADIVDGGIYLIVNEAAGMVMGEISGTGKGVAVNIKGDFCVTSDDVEIVLEKQPDGTYGLKNSAGYIGFKSDTNFDTPDKTVANSRYKWSVTVASPDSVVIRNIYDAGRYIRYNRANKDFRLYSSIGSTAKITLYRKMGALKITAGGRDTDGLYYATYFTDVPFVVPADVTCSTVGVKGGRLVVDRYNSGEIVPARTGLLVSALDPGIYEYAVLDAVGKTHGGNLLKGDVTDMMTEGEGCTFYRLAKPSGKALGFWWGAPDGGPFSLGAYKAYLAVPVGVSMAKGFSFEAATTAIENIAGDAISGGNGFAGGANHALFSLDGHRVLHKPTPGLYIIGGKKVMIK